MATSLREIIENTKELSMSQSSLEAMLDFERVLDELDLYAFRNWKKGELIAGPRFEKYYISAMFMWPKHAMPDPRGAERLLQYDCEVKYAKDTLEYPVKVESQDDFKPGTKVPKLAKMSVWLVEIIMPKSLMRDIERGALELENETIDLEDIEQAYEEGFDEDQFKTDQEAETNAEA